MPVLMPTALDLVEMEPPHTVVVLFDSLRKASLSWNAMLVTTATEREKLYRMYSVSPESVSKIESAISNDTRKIRVRRDVWTKTILGSLKQQPTIADDSDSSSDSDSSVAVQLSDDELKTPVNPISNAAEENKVIPKNNESDENTPAAIASVWPTALARTYSGIVNGGNTCYLNSVLQALFHLPVFRYHIYGIEEPPQDDEGLSIPAVCSALKTLFMELDLAHSRVETKRLTESFGWNDEEAARQHDVLELLQKLFESIETQFSLTPVPPFLGIPTSSDTISGVSTKTFLESLFGGTSAYITRATDDSGNVSRQNNSFIELQLTVKGNSNLVDSLKQATAVEEVDGKMSWDHADGTKSYHPVERSMVITKLPQVLLIHPQRVDFDPIRFQRVTISTRWEFPLVLNMKPFTDSANKEFADTDEDDFIYELRSLILHSGSAHYGHYVACVRFGDSSWRSFNDLSVWSDTQDDILDRAYGGQGMRSMRSDVRASLLCYVRRSKLAELVTELPATAEMAREVEAFHLRYMPQVTLRYHVLDGEFAKRIGNRDVPEAKSLTVAQNATVALVLQRLAAEENVTNETHFIALWRYKYLPQDEEKDIAMRVLTEEQMDLYSESIRHQCYRHPVNWTAGNFVLQLVDRKVDPRVFCEDSPAAPLTKVMLVRYWKDGFVHFFGTISSHEHIPHVVSLSEMNQKGITTASSEEDAQEGTTSRVVRYSDPNEDLLQSDNEAEPTHVEVVKQDDVSFKSFICLGATNGVRQVIRPQFLSSGANVVLTPTDISAEDLRDVLREKLVAVNVRWILPNNISQSVDVFSLTLDEHTKYLAIQEAIFEELKRPECSSLLPQMPLSAANIGLHKHHLDSDGAKRALEPPTSTRSGYHSYSHPTSLKDLTSAGMSHVPVYIIHFEILPDATVQEGFASLTQFLFNVGSTLRALTYVSRASTRTATDVISSCVAQAREVFSGGGNSALMDALTPDNVQLLGLNHYGGLVRTLSYGDSVLVSPSAGFYVHTWVVDVLDNDRWVPPQTDDEPQKNENTTVVASPDDSKEPTAEAATDVVESESVTVQQPDPFVRMSVEHVAKINMLEDFIELPTNILVHVQHDTGATVLSRIRRKMGIADDTPIEKDAVKLFVRGNFKMLLPLETKVSEVMSTITGKPTGLIVDHTVLRAKASSKRTTASSTQEHGISIRAQRTGQRKQDNENGETLP